MFASNAGVNELNMLGGGKVELKKLPTRETSSGKRFY